MAGGGTAQWYKDAVIYELHVRAFHDSDGDGVGDFRGLIRKLDYLQDLGITAIWLLPFYPSPGRDDGYDTADYTRINPAYGTLRDFRRFLREAHARGLRVITELVLNHTSDQHPWFQRARRASPGSPHRDFYVWSDTPDRYPDARIIFKDFETSNWTWDPVAGAYFWHRFYSHQPDLNYENPEVRKALYGFVDFWFDMGVDGLRLDAVPYLFEREGTNCENLPETHDALKDLRRHIDSKYEDRMLLAEANQWPEEAVAYFGDGDECHMAFHFPLMPRMFMAIRMEDRFPIIDILSETPAIPDGAQWAIFLRNHDELTLEMVTDEERDYMYRVYAEDHQARINLGIRRRLAPLLNNDRRLIEMMNGLLFSLPGTPVVYYGDEIGMGDNIYLGDRHGVRTPMQWSADRNAGFSQANPQKLYLPVVIDPEYHASAVNVEAQSGNANSLLWWMKRLIALRRRYQAFGRGTLEFLTPDNRKVLTFMRTFGEERILVVANLSRFAQYVELDLGQYEGMTPVALLGGVEFPPVGALPYLLTLGPHDVYWFSLEPQRHDDRHAPYDEGGLPALAVDGPWHEALEAGARAELEAALPAYLSGRRWFAGKARRLKGAAFTEVIPLGVVEGRPDGFLTLVRADFAEGESDTYLLPLAARPVGDAATDDAVRHSALARISTADGEHILYDGLGSRDVGQALLDLLSRRRRVPGEAGRLSAAPTAAFRTLTGGSGTDLVAAPLTVEQSNTSIVYGDRLIFKAFRRLEEGENPDLEITRFLAGHPESPAPRLAGALTYERPGSRRTTLGLLLGYVPNEGDTWRYTLDALGRFLDDALARSVPDELQADDGQPLLQLAAAEPSDLAQDTVGSYLESARLLGLRTAELHLALASDPADPAFAPEPFTALYRRSWYQSLRTLSRQTFSQLRRRGADRLPTGFLELEDAVQERLARVLQIDLTDVRIRCHGDYHLGQVLWTGRDFAIIDFEGEPLRPFGERRIKRTPLKDVGGMIRSFHYAAYTALRRQHGGVDDEQTPSELWVRYWYRCVSAAFLRSYLAAASGTLLPQPGEDTATLLDVSLLEKAMYELRYELANRPDWLGIPARGVRQLIEDGSPTTGARR